MFYFRYGEASGYHMDTCWHSVKHTAQIVGVTEKMAMQILGMSPSTKIVNRKPKKKVADLYSAE